MHPQTIHHIGDYNDATRRLGAQQFGSDRRRKSHISHTVLRAGKQLGSQVRQDARDALTPGPEVEGVDRNDRHVPITNGTRRSTILCSVNSAITRSRAASPSRVRSEGESRRSDTAPAIAAAGPQCYDISRTTPA